MKFVLPRLTRGASAVPLVTIPNFVSAYADSDLAGGHNDELSADTVRRIQAGLAAPGGPVGNAAPASAAPGAPAPSAAPAAA